MVEVEVALVVKVVKEDSAMARSDPKHIHTWIQSNYCTAGTSYLCRLGLLDLRLMVLGLSDFVLHAILGPSFGPFWPKV